MMLLVALAHAAQNLNRFLDGGLFDMHGLEAPFERRVAFDVLAILVERGRADALQFAARQGRLQDVRRIDGTARRACPDEHMHFVDEQNALRLLDFVDHALQALFKLSAIDGAGHERADVQHQHALVQQILRHVAADDALCEALDDRRLANAWLANQRRIVLAAARQYLNDALDLVLASDDGVEQTFRSLCGDIGAQLVDERRIVLLLALTLLSGVGRCLAHLLQRERAQLVQVDAQRLQHIGGDTIAFPYQPQQQVLGADIVMPHAARLVNGQLDDALGARRQADASKLTALAFADDLSDNLVSL